MGAAATDGTLFLDLTGFHDAAPYGGVKQTVTTISGQAYTLQFDLLSYESDSRYKGPVAVQASAGATSSTFTFTPPLNSTGNQHARFSLPFVASGTSTDIQIVGKSTAGGQFLGLDNVALVPEPSSLTLCGLLVSTITLRRRRAVADRLV